MTAFIVYDSFALADKANALLQRVAAGVGCPFNWNIIPRSTRELRDANAHTALKEARDAQLIVFAWRENRPFLSWIEEWLEKWASNRDIKDSAIAILNEGKSLLWSGTLKELLRFAARHDLVMFPGREKTSVPLAAKIASRLMTAANGIDFESSLT